MDYCNKSIAANYFMDFEAVGGKIYFDEQGFTFIPHALNMQTGNTRIEYDQISSVAKSNTLGIVPNGILVFTKDGFKHRFVINNRKKVIAFLESRCCL